MFLALGGAIAVSALVAADAALTHKERAEVSRGRFVSPQSRQSARTVHAQRHAALMTATRLR